MTDYRGTVRARELRADESGGDGDFLAGLDNGYVVEVLADYDGTVRVTFHDCDGNEGELTCSESMPVDVMRREPVPDLEEWED